MTASPARQLALPPSAAELLEDAREIVEQLMTVLDDRMTKAGHPYALVLHEHRGTCPPRECSLRCQGYRALFETGAGWIAAYSAREDA